METKHSHSLHIKRALPHDAPDVLHIFQSCARDMSARRGLDNWQSWLTETVDWMRGQIEQHELYIIVDDAQIVGTFTMQREPMRYYDMSLWQTPDDSAVYLRRLAVLPTHGGRGIGAWAISVFEQMARDEGYTTVRLDAYYRAARLIAYYKRHGFVPRGTVMLNETLGVVLMEKALTQN